MSSARRPQEGTRGILSPDQGLERFTLQRFDVDPRLSGLVSRMWSVRWALGDEAFEQAILPFPRVNMSFQGEEARVVGPSSERFVATLTGEGSVLGVRFEPAGFAAFSDRPMSSWHGARAPVAEVFGAAGARLACEVNELCEGFGDAGLPADRMSEARRRVESFLLERCARLDAEQRRTVEELNQLIEHAQQNRELKRAEQLAALMGCSLRSLQRLFERLVGVSPKWVLCRARAQEAAERVSSGETVDWVSLALELGYHDQAHFIRDFKAQVGFTPTAYAARCARRRGPR